MNKETADQNPSSQFLNTDRGKTKSNAIEVPSISLPKGGGAIRGIGEKFAANPVTGTGSMSMPIATSPGRSGFGPQLSLSYDSGAGNGPFGFGWSLSLPSITRKTDKGLPRYIDGQQQEPDSDEFILSGAEDLVPEFEKDGAGNFILQNGKYVILDKPRTVDGVTYRVRRYRPRIEGLFARIERWTNPADPTETFWRSISRDNITTWYGKTENSRIFDPEVKNHIFSWLICQSHDDKGNAIVYKYKEENSQGVMSARVCERNRSLAARTSNRYLKTIRYGNHSPYFPVLKDTQPWPMPPGDNEWYFEVVFDYDEHDLNDPKPDDAGEWPVRNDPFSSYRAGFEVRTYRLCQRVLMFHHIPDLPTGEKGYDGLVRSTDFEYSYEKDPGGARNPVYTFLLSVTQTGYNKNNGGGYISRSMPPVEFEYSEPIVQDTVQDVDSESLENLPVGLDGSNYQWTDLHGEGISGILTEQAGAWYYKRNLSPISEHPVEFAPLEQVALRPNLALGGGQAQFMDLAGDGLPDLVVMDGPTAGLYEHDEEEGWQPFRPFTSRVNRDMSDPNLKFIDLNGDGHADLLITEQDAFVWHRSLAEEGFGPGHTVAQVLDEEKGPRLVFSDGTQSIYLADLSGDGLTDIARIRNGEVCYWPNLGYGKFGSKVAMDNAPWFDNPDQFDQKRIRLADIDGSGTTDIIYLHRDGVHLYFNQSGNSWSPPKPLQAFPQIDNISTITPVDLKGNGTACLVWSTPLPGNASRQMRYVDLMGDQKPHLLIRTVNNLGAETAVKYAPSTKFYLQDKRDGRPWITRLPFPVHVVERVETYDHISRNRFVTHYAYHHGYFDGEEREFRGFGMVEQWDTEEIGALGAQVNAGSMNWDEASYVPPAYTKTWFHTGAYLDRERISLQFEHEYFRESGLNDMQARSLFLPDTVLPPGLALEEEREACRALRGSMLRQEIYALDGTDKEPYPYTVTEQNFTIELLQPKAESRHAIFFTHARETLNYHYERNPADPRISHAMTLEVDKYGNVLKSVAVGYGRRPGLSSLEEYDRKKQELTLITYTENLVTNVVDDSIKNPDGSLKYPDDFRTPLPAETRTYELTGLLPENDAPRFTFDELTRNAFARILNLIEEQYEWEVDYALPRKRLIEHVRTLYRPDDCGAAQNDPLALLPPGVIESRALPGESYKQAFTPGLATKIYVDSGKLSQTDLDSLLADEGRYVHSQGDVDWWMPSGRVFYSTGTDDDAAAEDAEARAHFYLPRRYRDPFHTDAFKTETIVTYDSYDLLVVETLDALDNRVTVGERNTNNSQAITGNDYRVLQPALVMDPNRNRTKVAFDILGMVAGTAVMGKPLPAPVEGDMLTGFVSDLTQAQLDAFFDATDPHVIAAGLLGDATTRIVYDLDRFRRTRQANPNDPTKWQPACAATLARETHVSAPLPPQGLKIQLSFSYSDGFGREIQKKIQAEPGPLDDNDPQVPVVNPRWVGSGWTIFNNKGKPVRQYEPFFSKYQRPDGTLYSDHRFEFGVTVGVSPILFYDPVGRVVTTLHPNHSYEKVVFDPWQQETWDVNDTTKAPDAPSGQPFDPKNDPDVGPFFERLLEPEYLPTWYDLRTDPVKALQKWPDTDAQGQPLQINVKRRAAEKDAAIMASAHTDTPAIAHMDALGRPFLTVAHNRVVCPGHPKDGTEEELHTRVELDIEGNLRAVVDAKGRVVMKYDYYMAGPDKDENGKTKATNRIYQISMEAGARWMLNDVSGKPIRAWDSRGFMRRVTYDELRRPVGLYVTESGTERLAEYTTYGESQGTAANHRTRVYQIRDGAGSVTSVSHDFKGNLLESRRELLSEYKTAVDWNQNPSASDGSFTTNTVFDALNRPVVVTAPDNSVYQPVFNEANLLDSVQVNLRGAADATPFVANINYNAKGQRDMIVYENGAQTTYEYDPFTFRLSRLKTTRPADPDAVASQLFQNAAIVQDLRYTYDPAGNITHIEDAALNTIFYNSQQVDPAGRYTYDAVYRLIKARGREHIGQTAFDFNPPNGNRRDYPFAGNAVNPNDTQALRNYIQQYTYDAVGNFETMIHVANGGSWTRSYDYEEDSLIEPSKKNNRLTRTTVGNWINNVENYTYIDDLGNDVHGCMTAINTMKMVWDDKDQLHQVDLGGGGKAYYVYDAGGQRVRKVIESSNGTRRKERVYIGAGFEVYREYNGDGSVTCLERETLHVMDDRQRIALVEAKTIDNGNAIGAPVPILRYQLGNHLGSASLELDENGALVSYEEYLPYGTTSFQAGRSVAEVSLKRYRYTGKERDEESGLYYYGARYYAAWVGRWMSCDPAGIADGVNQYTYVKNEPVSYFDPTGNNRKKSTLNKISDFLFKSGVEKLKERVVSGETKLTDFSASSVDAAKVFSGAAESAEFGKDVAPYVAVAGAAAPVAGVAGGSAAVVDTTAAALRGAYGMVSAASGALSKAGLQVSIRASAMIEQEAALAKIALETGLGKTGAAMALAFGESYLVAQGMSEGLPIEVVNPASLLSVGKSGGKILSDADLISKTDDIAQLLREKGLIFGKQTTIGILQGELDGEIVTLIAANNKSIAEARSAILEAGLLDDSFQIVDPIEILGQSSKTGNFVKNFGPKGNWKMFVDVEQNLAIVATKLGLTNSRVATSIPGCNMCSSTMGKSGDIWPDILHLNPSN